MLLEGAWSSGVPGQGLGSAVPALAACPLCSLEQHGAPQRMGSP